MRGILIIILFVIICPFTSCKTESVDGIKIGSELYEGQDYASNTKLRDIINRALNKEPQAFIDLNNFWCGGGAGCYDLGYVLTQIINKIGEGEFIKITQHFTENQRDYLVFLIRAGLEYGDNNYDGKMDDTRIENVYPNIKLVLAIPN